MIDRLAVLCPAPHVAPASCQPRPALSHHPRSSHDPVSRPLTTANVRTPGRQPGEPIPDRGCNSDDRSTPMSPDTNTLQDVFHGDRPFAVPVYQRPRLRPPRASQQPDGGVHHPVSGLSWIPIRPIGDLGWITSRSPRRSQYRQSSGGPAFALGGTPDEAGRRSHAVASASDERGRDGSRLFVIRIKSGGSRREVVGNYERTIHTRETVS